MQSKKALIYSILIGIATTITIILYNIPSFLRDRYSSSAGGIYIMIFLTAIVVGFVSGIISFCIFLNKK